MRKSLFLLPLLILAGCNSNNEQPTSHPNNDIITDSNDVLVAYFSVTNHTRPLAEYAQNHLNSDLFEIVPSVPYTSEDIDYNSDCRANREQNDDTARPEIKNQIEDMSKYDTIVLGYPIWWGQAPKIMYTFIESYNFEGKTILPFCTSGSSSIGTSATNLAKSAPNANWLEGRRFAIGTDEKTFTDWLDQYIQKKEDSSMKLKVDNTELDVTWEDNSSVKALDELGELNISMHRYGGFEQVGSIGHTLVSNDIQMTTNPGDIVLYSSNQLVIFFGSNSWSYTKLGHIDMNQNELNELLDKENVTATIQ